MTQQAQSPAQPNHPLPFVKSPVTPMLVGAGVGLAVILFFVLGVDNPHPDWPNYWYIRPLVVTPTAGAMGGLFFYLMDLLRTRGLNTTVAVILSVIAFFVSLWLGTVLGLAGTMWH